MFGEYSIYFHQGVIPVVKLLIGLSDVNYHPISDLGVEGSFSWEEC